MAGKFNQMDMVLLCNITGSTLFASFILIDNQYLKKYYHEQFIALVNALLAGQQ